MAAASPRLSQILQGERVVLRVNAEPGSPVSFYTPDGGEFSSRLKSVSVAANDQGVAETIYTAVTGTAGIVDILAASPTHSGQVRFAVKVEIPQ